MYYKEPLIVLASFSVKGKALEKMVKIHTPLKFLLKT